MRTSLCLALFVAASFCISSAAARETMQVEPIVTQQQQLRAEVEAGSGRYKDLSPAKRNELLMKQDSLLKILEGKQDTSQLSESQKLEAFNTLEWIAAATKDADDERMVCRHEKKTGSNRAERVCRTAAQMKKDEEGGRDAMLRMSKGGPRLGEIGR